MLARFAKVNKAKFSNQRSWISQAHLNEERNQVQGKRFLVFFRQVIQSSPHGCQQQCLLNEE